MNLILYEKLAEKLAFEKLGTIPGQTLKRSPPVFVEGRIPEHIRNKMNNSTMVFPASDYGILENVRVFGRGFLVGNDSLIIGNQIHLYEYQIPLLEREMERSKVMIPVAGLSCCIARFGDHIYGHWLVDILPRVHHILEEKMPIDHWLISNDTPEYALDLLEKLGVPQEKLLSYNPSQTVLEPEKLLIFPYCRCLDYFSPRIVGFANDLKSKYENGKPVGDPSRQIFVSRATLKKKIWRNLLNREEVERMFNDRGYELFNPQEHSMVDQIEMFHSARTIVGEYGSGLHNAIFAESVARVGILQSNSNGSFIQLGLNGAFGLDTYMLFGESFARPRVFANGEFLIDDLETERFIQRIGVS